MQVLKTFFSILAVLFGLTFISTVLYYIYNSPSLPFGFIEPGMLKLDMCGWFIAFAGFTILWIITKDFFSNELKMPTKDKECGQGSKEIPQHYIHS